MKIRALPLIVVLGWSVPSFAQAPPQNSDASRLQIACAPLVLPAPPNQALRIVGSHERGRMLFGPNEPLVVNAGTNQGIRVGQQYFVRRVVRDRFTPTLARTAASVHTAGWIRIVDAQADLSVATVAHACDGVMEGDYLEPFVDPVLPADARVTGEPDFAHPARIALGDEKHQSGAAGSLMLIDHGSDQGLRAGQTLTIYRDTVFGRSRSMSYSDRVIQARGPIMRVGVARVLAVAPQSALVSIESSRDAIYVGDLVAVNRVP
jgi:hypothetical protein